MKRVILFYVLSFNFLIFVISCGAFLNNTHGRLNSTSTHSETFTIEMLCDEEDCKPSEVSDINTPMNVENNEDGELVNNFDFADADDVKQGIPSNIQVSVSPEDHTKIRISWDQLPQKNTIKHYVVYRKSIDNSKFYSQLGTVLPNKCQSERCWFDNEVKNLSSKASTWYPFQRYLYRITSVGQDNKESKKSFPIEGVLEPINHSEVLKDVWKTLVRATHNRKKVTNSSALYLKHNISHGSLDGTFESYMIIENSYVRQFYKYESFKEYNSIVVDGTLIGIRNNSSDKILTMNGTLKISGLYNATLDFENCQMNPEQNIVQDGIIKVTYNEVIEEFSFNDSMLDVAVIK